MRKFVKTNGGKIAKLSSSVIGRVFSITFVFLDILIKVYNTSMFWQITAAIAATSGLIFAIFVFIYPRLQRRRRRTSLLRIDELRKQVITLGKKYRKVEITEEELEQFITALGDLRTQLLGAINDISKVDARKYEFIGFIDLSLYRSVKNPKHQEYLALCVKWVEISEAIIEKYS